MKESVSIIITSKNDRETISYSLKSVMNFAKFFTTELVIVDGMSTDGTRFVIDNFETRYNNLFYNFIVIQEPGISLSYARNLGFKKSSGSIIIFLDGDMVLHPNFTKQFKTLFQMNNFDIIAPGIEVLSLDYFTKKFNMLSKVITRIALSTKKPSIINQARIFTREALNKLQGYPVLSKYFGEDRIVTAFCKIKGLRYIYKPNLKIVKIDKPSFCEYLKKHIRYGEGIDKDLSYGGKRILRDYILTRRLTYINIFLPINSILYAIHTLSYLSGKMSDAIIIFLFKYAIDLSMLIGELKAMLEKIR